MRVLPSVLLAAALTAPFAAALALAEGSGGSAHDSAHDADAGASGSHPSGASGNATNASSPDEPGSPPANGTEGSPPGGGEARSERGNDAGAGDAGSDGRDGHGGEAGDARDACRDLRGAQRGACEENATAAQRAEDEQGRAAFERERQALLKLAPDERLGAFQLVNGTWQGRFVSFAWDPATLTLGSYTVGGVLVLDRLTFTGVNASAPVQLDEHGRVAKVELGHAKLLLHDNPAGTLAGSAPEGGSLRLSLSPALNASMQGNTVHLLGPGNFTAALHGDHLALANGTLLAPGEVTLVAHEDNVALPGVANEHRDDIQAAEERGRVGAEVTVAGNEPRDIEEQVLDAPLQVNTTHTAGGVLVSFNATGLGPRTIVLNVAAGLLRGDRVNVTYYDVVNGTLRSVPIVEASNLSDVLDPTDDSTPEYWVVHDRDGVQVLVSVPHFSAHAFEVQGVLQDVPPSVLAGALGAVLLVAASGVGLLARRKR